MAGKMTVYDFKLQKIGNKPLKQILHICNKQCIQTEKMISSRPGQLNLVWIES